MNEQARPARRGSAEFLRVRHLRLLELVERGGSLAAAARQLHLSQPAVTKMLHELENAFAATLVVRGARGGSLTAEGRVVLQRLRLGLAQFDMALRTAGSARAHLPMLRIGVLPLVSVSLLPRAAAQMWKRGAPATLVLREGTAAGLLQLLSAGDVDCVVGRAEPDLLAGLRGAGLQHFALSEERLVVACPASQKLATSRRAGLPQLAAQQWILPATGSHTRRLFDAMFLTAGMQPPAPIIESMSFHANLQLIVSVGALTVAPQSAVALYQRMGIVKAVRHAPQLSGGPLSMMYFADSEQLSALTVLRDALKAAAVQQQRLESHSKV